MTSDSKFEIAFRIFIIAEVIRKNTFKNIYGDFFLLYCFSSSFLYSWWAVTYLFRNELRWHRSFIRFHILTFILQCHEDHFSFVSLTLKCVLSHVAKAFTRLAKLDVNALCAFPASFILMAAASVYLLLLRLCSTLPLPLLLYVMSITGGLLK